MTPEHAWREYWRRRSPSERLAALLHAPLNQLALLGYALGGQRLGDASWVARQAEAIEVRMLEHDVLVESVRAHADDTTLSVHDQAQADHAVRMYELTKPVLRQQLEHVRRWFAHEATRPSAADAGSEAA